MLALVRALLVLDIIAIACEHVFPVTHGFLPIGGSHLAQVGIILIGSLVIVELHEALKDLREFFAASDDQEHGERENTEDNS